MANARLFWVADTCDRLAWFNHALREPAIPRFWPKEISSAIALRPERQFRAAFREQFGWCPCASWLAAASPLSRSGTRPGPSCRSSRGVRYVRRSPWLPLSCSRSSVKPADSSFDSRAGSLHERPRLCPCGGNNRGPVHGIALDPLPLFFATGRRTGP